MSCGGGGSLSPIYQPVNSTQSAELINGISVPKSPGDQQDATVAGIDSDGNGIRDEVDRAIATQYGFDPIKYAAAQYSARIGQQLLLTDASNQVLAQKAMYASFDGGACLSRIFRSDPSAGLKLMHYVDALTYNTPERRAQHAKIAAATGAFSRSTGAAVCP